MKSIKATIITIGDELLIGQVIDTNSAWIAQQLNKIGIQVERRVAVGDNREAILNALDSEKTDADILIMTGGLGPTSDDITKPLLCEYFNSQLVVNEIVLNHIKSIFESRKRPIIERNMKQAEVPECCKVLFNRMGTAPGMWFEKDNTIFISLPGVPFEMRCIMEEETLHKLKALTGTLAIVHRTVFTAGEGESFIAEKLIAFEAALPQNVSLAYLPDAGMVRLRLTGTSDNEQALTAQLNDLQQQIASILGNIVIALEDKPVEILLGDTLKAQHKTLALAESCTGGYIAHCLTQPPGASQYLAGGTVCYSIQAKEHTLGVPHETISEFGAVSEQTAVAMAKGALENFGSDVAIAVTGLLGPDGDGEQVPVGTVWVAAGTRDEMRTRCFKFPYDRPRNKDMAAKNAMLLLWRLLNDRL